MLFSEAESVMVLPAPCGNGKYVAFTWGGYHKGNKVNIWRVNADGTDPKQLTDDRDLVGPVCSPDGKWVYFRDGFSQEIKRVPIDGGKTEVVPGTKIADAELDDTPVALSPDGKWLAFSIHVEPTGNETAHQTKIVLLSLEGAAGVPGKGSLGDQSGGASNGADAGKRAGTAANASAANPIKRIVSPDQRISGHAEFTPEGKAIVYPVRAAGVDNLWLQPLEGSAAAAKRITNFTSDVIDAYHWSLDGKQLGVLQRHVVSDVVLLRDTSK